MHFYAFNSQLSTFNSQLFQPDEHSQTGILTSASNRLPAFPSRTAEQWPWEFVAVTVAQPSRIFTGFPDI
jgi:hypothetical protein